MKDFKLQSFFIFDPNLKSSKYKPSDEELQEAKIIYYYPQNESLVIQRSNTGIVEGTIDFYKMFDDSNSKLLIVDLIEKSFICKEYEKSKFFCLIVDTQKCKFSINDDFKFRKECFEHLIDNLYYTFYLYHGAISNLLDPLPQDLKEMEIILEGTDKNLKARCSTKPEINIKSQLINTEYERSDTCLDLSKKILLNNEVYANNNENDNSIEKKDLQVANNDESRDDKDSGKNKLIEEWLKKRNNIITDFIENYFVSITQKNRLPFYDKVNYFPLNDTSFAHMLLDCRRLKEKFNDIKYMSLCYKGYVFHNEIPIESFSILYNHYFSNLDSSSKYSDFKLPPYSIVQTVYGGYEPEKKTKDCSPFRKGYDGLDSYQQIGISMLNVNNYLSFVPKLYLHSSNETVKLLVYVKEGLVIYIYLDSRFDPRLNLSKLVNIDKWIKRFFQEDMFILRNLHELRTNVVDSLQLAYFNESNSSIKLSSHFFDKSRNIILERLDPILEIMQKYNIDSIFKLTRTKHTFVFIYTFLCRKYSLTISNSMEIKEAIKKIEEFKVSLFDHLLIL